MKVVNILYHGIFGNLNFFTYLSSIKPDVISPRR